MRANLTKTLEGELGWASACRNFCKELSTRANPVVKCSIARLSQRSPPAVELNLFRIVQEALNNVEKHAQAKTVWLRFTMHDDGIVLRIQDDGRGFDLKQSKTRKRERGGLGLTNMRERAAALGGGCEVESTPEQGAQITVRVPRVRLA